MAVSIQQVRCLLHPIREAVARCKGCEEYFCRECVAEHEGEMLCSSCLESDVEEAVEAKPKKRRLPILSVVQLALGLFLIWVLWYGMAQIVLKIPSKVHSGQFWEEFSE